LSGANAHKTSIVVLHGSAGADPLTIMKVYEKIGPLGSLFSDERIIEILAHEADLKRIMVDCPLTLPPCVTCTREVCPGAKRCEDVSVAWMLSMGSKIPKKQLRNAKPINTQVQRLWDIYNLFDKDGGYKANREEPSYSANQAPLVGRAQALGKRIKGAAITAPVLETSVYSAIKSALNALGLNEDVADLYRKFESGRAVRQKILKALDAFDWIDISSWPEDEVSLSDINNFNALITAWVGALNYAGLTNKKPQGFTDTEGWVLSPQLTSQVDIPTKKFTT